MGPSGIFWVFRAERGLKRRQFFVLQGNPIATVDLSSAAIFEGDQSSNGSLLGSQQQQQQQGQRSLILLKLKD
eukprot:scaffold3304_cov154-Amphora_coffeaeformis.AAC.15